MDWNELADCMGKGIKHVVLGLGMAAAACYSVAQAAEPIKIGVTLAMSPPGSVVQGAQLRDGFGVALKMINDQGGVLGRPVELVYEDTQGIPEKARAAAEKLITKERVVAITGEHQSSAGLAAIEVAHRYRIPYLNSNAWADAIREKGYPEVFNPGNYSTRVALAMAEVLGDLKSKRVVCIAENTDYGIGLSKTLGELLKARAPDVQYKVITVDRAGRDFLPVILPLRADPPDAIVQLMLPPAAYIMINQLNEQGVAPSAKTWLYEASGVADYPDFWKNVQGSARGMLTFGLYHPEMPLLPLGDRVAKAYLAGGGKSLNRLMFQGADSLFLIVEAIKNAGSTDPEAMLAALRKMKWDGTRGVVSFSQEPGYRYNQWLEVPYVTLQITKVNQPIDEMKLVQGPGKPLNPAAVSRVPN
jgi:branched-chain amino acid transport system substrate-binding protein